MFLRTVPSDADLHDIRLYPKPDTVGFPTQYAGLRYFNGTVRELCLVAIADAPAGSQWRIRKGGVDYAVYLVVTTDPNASHVRIRTGAGVMSARLKT